MVVSEGGDNEHQNVSRISQTAGLHVWKIVH